MPVLHDSFKLGERVIIAQEADIRGDITIGNGTVLHPKCTVLAMAGPIVIGQDCIVDELAVIVNRRKTPLVIGPCNHFQIGSRIESPSVGAYNTFEPRSRVHCSIAVGDFSTIGAGCAVVSGPSLSSFASLDPDADGDEAMASAEGVPEEVERLPDRTVVFGADSRRRIWSGEGIGQQKAFHAKHVACLHEMLPKYTKLKQLKMPPSVAPKS